MEIHWASEVVPFYPCLPSDNGFRDLGPPEISALLAFFGGEGGVTLLKSICARFWPFLFGGRVRDPTKIDVLKKVGTNLFQALKSGPREGHHDVQIQCCVREEIDGHSPILSSHQLRREK